MNISSVSMAFRLFAAIATALACASHSSASNFTTTVQQASADANHWNATIWNPGPVAPTPGNTYQVLAGGRVRSPNGTAGSGGTGAVDQTFTFPGDSLTLDGNGFSTTPANVGELRIKHNFNGVTFHFPGVGGSPGLILNGGMLNDGDERIMKISGIVGTIAGKTSSINPGGQGITGISAARGFNFLATLVGEGNLSLDYGHDFGATGVTAPALQISSSNPTFAGDWIVNSGWLQGSGANSLGFGDITLTSLQAPSTLDLNYDLIHPTGALTLTGATSKLVLDQNLTFGSVASTAHRSRPASTHSLPSTPPSTQTSSMAAPVRSPLSPSRRCHCLRCSVREPSSPAAGMLEARRHSDYYKERPAGWQRV